MSARGFIGDLLIRKGIVDADGLTRATADQSDPTLTLGRRLARLGLADEETVARAVADALRLEHLTADAAQAVDPALASLVPPDYCRKRHIAPIRVEGKVLSLAVTDPMDYSTLQDVEFRTSKKLRTVVASQTVVEQLHARLFRDPSAGTAAQYDAMSEVQPTGEIESIGHGEYEVEDPAVLAKDTELPPIVRLVNLILSEAANAGASDIHIEPQEDSLQVRQRVDGLLRETLTIPRHLQDQTISRLKIISGMDIAERRKPQDGRSQLRFQGRRIDLRVSTLPTQYGEKVVIRLLAGSGGMLGLDQIGLSPEHLKQFQSLLSRPQGLILVTGPTGSGKTSTLYTALNAIKTGSNNIITLEDPIEFRVPGVNQTQINARAGVTFASGLRSILRQDPNVILVGEIRDHETADIALQAAQTGHLLLSTLHTNDAIGSVTRLFDLGVQPFLVAASLLGIVAQRLVRRPCASCAQPAPPSTAAIEKAGGASKLPPDATWIAGTGCDKCAQSGFKGRIAVHEMLVVNDELRELIANRATEVTIKKAARRAGMRSLAEDGITKAAAGLTTLDELFRVVTHSEPDEAAESSRAHESATPAAEPPPPAPVAASTSAPQVTGASRVLVVEDSPTIASVVKYFLELQGFSVLLAEDGRRGLEFAFRESPDVIVSDVNMPGMGGVEMVRALRKDPRTAGTRILMLTSEDSVESETEGLAAGADDYILKPVEPRRLAARVKALLGRPPRS